MPKTRLPHAPGFRRQMIELVRAIFAALMAQKKCSMRDYRLGLIYRAKCNRLGGERASTT